MSVRLLVRQRSEEGGGGESRELLLHEAVINLGRDKSAEVVLPLQAVSRSHARITRDGALFFVEDLGSAYGTQVNGQTLPKGEKRLLRDGDVLGIAQFDVTFERLPDVPQTSGKDETSMVARHMVKSAMRALGGGEGPYLRLMNGPDEGKHIQLSDAREVVLGRDEDVDVVLKDDLVSRRHAKVRRDWAGTHIEDLGSRNGIKVNRKRVTRKTLADRDEVEVGGVKLLYVDPTEVHEARPAPVEEEGEDTPPTGREAPSSDEEAGEGDAGEEASEASEEEVADADDAQDGEGDVSDEEPEPDDAPPVSRSRVPLAALDAEGAGPELGEEEEQASDEDEGAENEGEGDEEVEAPREMKTQQWVILGVAGVAALFVLALVLLVLVGA